MDWKGLLFELINFLPRVEGPLVVELVEFLRNHEHVIMAIDWGDWDFIGSTEDAEEPEIAIKSVKNRISPSELEVISKSPIPVKVILVEGFTPNLPLLSSQAGLLAAVGVGVYVRDVGWLALPAYVPLLRDADALLARTKWWKKNAEGIWVKKCRYCRVEKTQDGFYRTGKDVGKDPYRGICKECDNARRVARQRGLDKPRAKA